MNQTVSPPAPASRPQKIAALGLLLAGLAYYLWQIHFGFNPFSISDEHGFRQTQTAVSVQEFIRAGGLSLDYGTPFLGRPWSVPFEFPVYQALVYFTVSASGLDIVTAGRIVSVVFYLVCLALIYLIARQLGARFGGLIAVLAGLTTPFYLFWSRAFLIESTALAFSLGALFLALRVLERPRGLEAVALFGCAGLAAATKITTFFPIAAGLGLLCVMRVLIQLKAQGLVAGVRSALRNLGLWIVTCAVLCAFGCAYLWTAFADDIKAAHPLAGYLTSGALKPWVYGSWNQRLEAWRWGHLLNHYLFGFGSHPYFSLALLISIVILGLLFSRRRWWVLFFLALFLLPIAVFFNLYVVHNYYSNANLIFLLTAAGIALSEWSMRVSSRSIPLMLGVLLVGSLSTGMADAHYSRLMVNELPIVPCLRHLRRVTPKQALIVGFGWGISPEIAFYSNRRAMLYNGFPEAQWDSALDLQESKAPKVVVIEPAAHAQEIEMALRTAARLGLIEKNIEGCKYRLFSADRRG